MTVLTALPDLYSRIDVKNVFFSRKYILRFSTKRYLFVLSVLAPSPAISSGAICLFIHIKPPDISTDTFFAAAQPYSPNACLIVMTAGTSISSASAAVPHMML